MDCEHSSVLARTARTAHPVDPAQVALAGVGRGGRPWNRAICSLAAAMVWYTQGRISHEKAASFAGVSRIDFIDSLAATKRPAFRVDVDELMEEVELAHQANREHVAPGLSRPGRSSGNAPGRSQ